ncbi:hypothetical protein Rs2_51546 [Raphanus sativus]|nr:hypothetical protein Rs2_51546 [Raphanus sativus]
MVGDLKRKQPERDKTIQASRERSSDKPSPSNRQGGWFQITQEQGGGPGALWTTKTSNQILAKSAATLSSHFCLKITTNTIHVIKQITTIPLANKNEAKSNNFSNDYLLAYLAVFQQEKA